MLEGINVVRMLDQRAERAARLKVRGIFGFSNGILLEGNMFMLLLGVRIGRHFLTRKVESTWRLGLAAAFAVKECCCLVAVIESSNPHMILRVHRWGKNNGPRWTIVWWLPLS